MSAQSLSNAPFNAALRIPPPLKLVEGAIKVEIHNCPGRNGHSCNEIVQDGEGFVAPLNILYGRIRGTAVDASKPLTRAEVVKHEVCSRCSEALINKGKLRMVPSKDTLELMRRQEAEIAKEEARQEKIKADAIQWNRDRKTLIDAGRSEVLPGTPEAEKVLQEVAQEVARQEKVKADNAEWNRKRAALLKAGYKDLFPGDPEAEKLLASFEEIEETTSQHSTVVIGRLKSLTDKGPGKPHREHKHFSKGERHQQDRNAPGFGEAKAKPEKTSNKNKNKNNKDGEQDQQAQSKGGKKKGR